MAFAQQVGAQTPDPVQSLLQQDTRLSGIAERIMAANASLCAKLMPLTGIVLHTRDQYADGRAGDAFANGDVSVAAVLPDSPAMRAGVRAGDGVLAIGETLMSGLRREGEAPLRDAAFAVLANTPSSEPLPITVRRGTEEHLMTLAPQAGCRALVEIRAVDTIGARSDGRVIQVNHGLAAAAGDEQLAVIFAHELGHVVLEHRRRLEADGVKKGFFGEFGSNQQRNREVEVEADRISVHLLANAGYDPQTAASFWRTSLGRRAGGGILHSRVYPSPEARARLIEREINDYLPLSTGPTHPGHLLARRQAGTP